MKKLFSSFLAIMLMLPSVLFSQGNNEPIKLWTIYPGYIITKSNDTIQGYLMLKNKISNQGKVFFFDSPNAEKPSAKYKPKDIKGYKVADRVYETMKYSPEYTTMKYSFLLKTVDGKVKFFKSYFDDKERIKIDEDDIWNSKIDLSFSEEELKEVWLGSKDGKKIENFNSFGYLLNFSKNMSKFLSDCPEIANKIANKEKGYEYGNLEKIIREYNEKCGE
ncbi:MAG: hypothetical protein KA807_09280 [Prolixibacteraceae bacterium]|nr:hypothetical protein [Prolixibacteraceae bacterium]